MPRLSDLGEWELIQAIGARTGLAPPGTLGIGDDAAVTTLGPGLQALTTLDMLVEGVHFRRGTTSTYDLGHKTLAVNLSDIAAMGGQPRWAVLGLALPAELELDWVLAFYDGLLALANATDTLLVGGDTVGSPGPLVISLTLVGECVRPLTRSAARPGDTVFMTGPAGLAAAGLWCLEHPAAGVDPADRRAAEHAHLRPTPQLRAGRAIAKTGLRVALLDNSDGLARSAIALGVASKVDIVLTSSHFPMATTTQRVAALAGISGADWVLDGGEDYGLVGSVAPTDWPTLAAALIAVGQPGSRVGEVVTGNGCAWVQDPGGGRDALTAARGYHHF